ncbi:MAG: hypothetical protein N2110_06880 [Flavobacteriales bacterium]|nr:hypothetical protein [Flavobacteriales bacterium]MCX7768726.1 hypothetical protein [Flavobacteriales bacterium]MDW8409886.1 hypothetical protein [Flavobacteriales bacterium]
MNTFIKIILYYTSSLVALTLFSCKTQHAWLRLGNLSDYEVYQPSRRQAWPFSRAMPYDKDVVVSEISRSWTTAYNLRFIVAFSGAKEKFRFRVLAHFPESPDTFRAEVFCTTRIKETDFPLFGPGIPPLFLNLMPPDKYQNFFFGQIYPSDTLKWGDSFFSIGEPRFIMLPGQGSEGYLLAQGKKFAIVGVTSVHNLKGTKPVFTGRVVGFEVYDADTEKIVMGVSAVNEGRVWLRKDLPIKHKNHLMALASAMLLRRDLKEKHEEIKSGYSP